ncbi:MAG TPA: chromate transporter [Stellaceae bacterium]|nr:chromate transporter [Stellaceae bacterium]
MSEIHGHAAPRSGNAGLVDLFVAFMQISLSGFGGAINWAHRALVQRRHWMSDEDFTETLSLCQFLPGPNIVNFAMCLGQRQHGASGAAAAVAGVIAVPLVIFVALGVLYTEFGQIAVIHGILSGISAAAAGFIITVGIRLARPHRDKPLSALFGLAAFLGMGLFRFPLIEVMIALAPLSVAIAWWRQR